jgi:hypothetical protein
MTKDIDWQEIANDLSEGIRELHTTLDNYNAVFDRADEARKAISDDELLEGFSDEWNEAEGGVMAIEEQIRDLAKLTDFIEEKLV